MKNNINPPTVTGNKSKYILSIILGMMLIAGLVATYWLTQQNQDIRQQARYIEPPGDDGGGGGGEDDGSACAASGGSCVSYSTCVSVNGDNLGPSDCSGATVCCVTGGGGAGSGDGGNEGETCRSNVECTAGLKCISGKNGKTCRDSSKYECDLNGGENTCSGAKDGYNPCHCTGGDACTGTTCDDSIQKSCEDQGRSYCDNYQGIGKTCCVEGYVCGENGAPGCYPGPKPSSPPSSPKPSPTPTPPVGPQCLDIKMDNPDVGLNEQTTFTCGAVSGVDHYVFRVKDPAGIIQNLTAVNNTSASYLVDQSGTYYAQCQICTGADSSTCLDWEKFPEPTN